MKEKTILEYTIKIRRVMETKWISKGCYENTDKLFLIDIKDSIGGGIGFAVKAGKNYGTNLRNVFRRIKEVLHL